MLKFTLSFVCSQAIVYFLDKFVWMLLITAVTTQALQIAGVVDPPKGLEDITYNEVRANFL